MKVEPAIDREAAIRWIRREYGLPIEGLNGDLFGFYFYRRNLEDLTDWVIRVLCENTRDEQDENDLNGILEDCMDGWPHFETAIEQIKAQLADNR
jgi:hypothetical protein